MQKQDNHTIYCSRVVKLFVLLEKVLPFGADPNN